MVHLVADQTATLRAIRYDGNSDSDAEITTSLSNVSWYEAVQVSPSSSGLAASNVYKIRVFEDQLTDYLPLEDWRAVSATDKAIFWSVAPGDKITHGSTTATVVAIHDNRGSRRNAHLYLEAR